MTLSGKNEMDSVVTGPGWGADVRLGCSQSRQSGSNVRVSVPLFSLTVLGGQMVYGFWEDMRIDIWGPRTGL